MPKMEAEARSWTVAYYATQTGDGGSSHYSVKKRGGRTVAKTVNQIATAEDEKSIRFIVHACRLHADLVDAVKDLLDAYAPHADKTAAKGGENCLHSSVRKAREILRKAKR
jgi:hypothetical protein